MAANALQIRGIDQVQTDVSLLLVRFGRRRLRVRRVDLEPMQLCPGDVLTVDAVADLEAAAKTAKAFQAAVRALGRRPMAAAALRARLGSRFGDQAAHTVIESLLAQGVLDDASAAASLRRGMERRGPMGTARYAQALARHEIDPDVAQEAINDLDQQQDHVEAAMTAAEPMLRALSRFDRSTRARRLAGRLARRGFDAQTVHDALDRLGLTD